MADYEVVRSEVVFEGRIVRVLQDVITLPNGNEALREIVRRADGACVLPVLDDGRVVLVRQYRHTLRAMVLEVPAGTVEPGEEHDACAMRELEEEAGYKASQVHLLAKVCGSIGFCGELIYVYYADNLTKGVCNPDPEEFIEVETYTLEEAVKMVFDGRIVDAKTATAILAYKEKSRRS